MAAEKPFRDPNFALMRQIVSAQWRAGEEWIREREISIEQGGVLGYLLDHPGAIQRDIAKATNRGEASVSAMLQKLDKRGLVERRAENGDDRSKRVYATPAGAELIAGLDVAMAAVDEVILAALTVNERRKLEAVLRKITAGLEPVVCP
jgi:MarR family transcriptional repressor of mepA